MPLTEEAQKPVANPSSEFGVQSHWAILQGLDQFVPSKLSDSGRMWYGFENYTGTEPLWDKCSVFFFPEPVHMDWSAYLADPAKTLKKHNARIVGVNRWSRVVDVGSKRLESEPYLWDDAVNRLLETGGLGVSTDFDCPFSGENLIGSVRPNYIAVFPISQQNDQNDLGARFMNSANPVATNSESTDEVTIMDAETKGAFDKITSILGDIGSALKNIGSKPAVHQNAAGDALPGVTELVSTPTIPVEFVEKLNTVEAEKAQTLSELEAAKQRVQELESAELKRVEEQKKSEMEGLTTEWTTSIKTKLPPGLTHEVADNEKLQKLWLENPRVFLRDYGQYFNKTELAADPSHANAASGQTHPNSNQGAPADEKPMVIGSYNAASKQYEV